MRYKFKQNDVFHNRAKTYPKCKFFIYDRKVYYNNNPELSGQFAANLNDAPPGAISLYELNVDRPVGQKIYPFITKDGSRTAFKTISTSEFNTDFSYGDTITGSYPLLARINKHRWDVGATRPEIIALKNTLNDQRLYSPHYDYDSSLGDKGADEIGLITIPSLFYGSSIRKGSVNLKVFITGSLIAHAQDIGRNGELVQVLPSGSFRSGSVGGVVLYNQGFVVLTGSYDLTNGEHTEVYTPGLAAHGPRWIDFASTGSTGAGENIPQTSFELSFEGVNYIPTLTMLCHAPIGELNYSSNPTWVQYGQNLTSSIASAHTYTQNRYLTIKNTVKTPYADPTGSFSKTTFISGIKIYDEDGNVIAVAKLAQPVKKIESRDLTFKLVLDI